MDLSGCTNLSRLDCQYNQIGDISWLVAAASQGILRGGTVHLVGNPLDDTNQVTELRSYGVNVVY